MAKANATPAATPATPATRVAPNAGKYHAAPRAVPVATVRYTITALGVATANAKGAGKSGKVTVMGLVAVAASAVAAKGMALTGANIVAAMRALPAVNTAFKQTRAATGYARGALPCPAWCSGYVAGAARSPASLLAKA